MSTVKITDNLVYDMVYRFSRSFDADRDALPQYPNKMPMGVGDELYSLLWPLDKEEEARARMPTWAVTLCSEFGVYTPYGYRNAKFSKSRMNLGRSPILTPPGFSYFRWDGGGVSFEVNDLDKVEIPTFKQFMQDCAVIAQQHADFEKSVEEEANKLSAFLNNHRTLQQAVAEFGESLMTFVPERMKKQYYAGETTEEKKPEPEKVEVDINSLVARATAESLGMTGSDKVVEPDDLSDVYSARRSRAKRAKNSSGMLYNTMPQATSQIPLAPLPYKFNI